MSEGDKVTKWMYMLSFADRALKQDEGWQEAKLLCQLQHFHILVFYGMARQGVHVLWRWLLLLSSDSVEQDGIITIITEYVPLGSLHRVLADQKIDLPWWLRMKFAMDAADALQ